MARDELLNRPCGGRFGNIVESIGNTPLVELPRLSPKPDVRIYAKLEGHNPTGSVKDRVAKSMIEAAEAEGAIEPGQTILEPTSGNTGIALAMICRRKGYPLKVVMPDNVTEERTQLLRCTGRRSSTPRAPRAPTARSRWRWRWPRTRATTCPTSTATRPTRCAHYNGTAVEILEELDEVAAFVGGLGTGGTLMGNGRRLKEANPETLIVAAEPMQGELVQGLRSLDDGFIPPIIDLSLLDRKIMVSNRDAIVWTKQAARRGGRLRRRLRRRDRRDRRPHRRRARRRQRRLPDPRRRLEVPLLRRLHEADRGDREPRLHRLVVRAGTAHPGARSVARVQSTPRSLRP